MVHGGHPLLWDPLRGTHAPNLNSPCLGDEGAYHELLWSDYGGISDADSTTATTVGVGGAAAAAEGGAAAEAGGKLIVNPPQGLAQTKAPLQRPSQNRGGGTQIITEWGTKAFFDNNKNLKLVLRGHEPLPANKQWHGWYNTVNFTRLLILGGNR